MVAMFEVMVVMVSLSFEVEDGRTVPMDGLFVSLYKGLDPSLR